MIRSIVLSACVVGACFAGCATLPEYRQAPLTTADVIRHIKCELRDAAYAYPENEWVRDWTVGLIFEFQVLHSGGLEADAASWTFPLNQGANFVIALTGGFSGQGTRTERINFKVAMNEVNKEPLNCYEEDRNPGRHALLGGRLGITDLFERTRLTMRDANVPEKRMSQLDYNIEYLIRKSGTVSPRFNLIPIGKEKVFTGSAKWTGSFSDTQSVKITLTPPAAEKECPVVMEDGSAFAKCPEGYAAIAVIPACSILAESACNADAARCVWTPSEKKCKGRTLAKSLALRDGRPAQRSAPAGGLSKADVQKNDAAQLQNLILDRRLLGN